MTRHPRAGRAHRRMRTGGPVGRRPRQSSAWPPLPHDYDAICRELTRRAKEQAHPWLAKPTRSSEAEAGLAQRQAGRRRPWRKRVWRRLAKQSARRLAGTGAGG